MDFAKLRIEADSRQVRTANSDLRQMSDAGGRAERSTALLKRAVLSLGVALSARELIRYADTWTNISNRLNLVTDSTEELTRAQNDLFAIAQDTRQSFESTAQLYQRISSNAENLGLSYRDLLGITKTVNQAMAVSGATAQESAAAIIQLGQALGSGELRGDEFRSIAEQAPRLRDALVQGLGVDGVGALREMAEQGELTADRVIAALQSQGEVIDEEFGAMESTIGQAATTLSNSMIQLIGKINEATGASRGLVEVMNQLSDLMDDATAGTGNWDRGLFALTGQQNTYNDALLTTLERLRMFNQFNQNLGVTFPLSPTIPEGPMEGLGGGIETTAEELKPIFDDVGDLRAEVEAERLRMLAERQAEELIMENDHTQMMREIEEARIEMVKEMDEEEKRRASEKYEFLLNTADAYFSGLEGREAAYARAAISIGKAMLTEKGRMQIQELWNSTRTAAMDAYGALAGIPIIGPALGVAAAGAVLAFGADQASDMVQSFEGGGFTGSGSRTGGMDGRGGFMAMVHPNEQIVDLTKSKGSTSGGQMTENYSLSVNIQTPDPRGMQEFFADNPDFFVGLINRARADRGKGPIA